MMYWNDGGYAWWMLVVNLVFGLVLVGGIVAAITVFTRRAQDTPPASVTSGQSSAARPILEERFARGEIDADEFQRRMELLRR